MGKMRQHDKFRSLSSDAQSWLLLLGHDPGPNGIDWLVHDTFGGTHGLLFYQNYLPDIGALTELTLGAVELWRRRQPQAAALAAAAAAARAGRQKPPRHSRPSGG